jgi:gluconolactonase
MKLLSFALFGLCLSVCLSALAQVPVENYPVDSASVVHPGVPKGEILKFKLEDSKIFPGQMHEYSVYIPAEYDPAKPACVYINQDGIQANAPVVFDNLIYSKEMPVTIGVFILPGRLVSADEKTALDRYGRSFEYDGLGDAYARFLVEELLPAVEKQNATDGRAIHLLKSGNDRAIGGQSSGAIAAFTAAWERPNEFSKVFSGIGTYVGLRGGDRYLALIRKYETKPIKVFLQDGSNDQNAYGGDWWFANQMMERSLVLAGNPVMHAWGEGGHNGRQSQAVFPTAMRWLWKDYPKPVTLQKTKNQYLSDILIPGEEWQLVGEGYGFSEGPAVNAKGEVFYQDIPNAKTYKVGLDGKLEQLKIDSKKAGGTAFGPDGMRYTAATATNQVLQYDVNNKVKVIADGIPGNDIVVGHNGNIYVTAPDGAENPGKIYLIRPNGQKVVVDEGLKFPNGIALTPDQTQLYVPASASHWVWIFQIKSDGTLANKQKYDWLYTPDTEDNAWPDGMKCDTAGRVYVATRLGIQVADQAGRVNAIIPVPTGMPSNICFGGPNFDMMYVTSKGKVYRRKLRTRGANAFEAPVKPVKPRL